MSFGGKKQMMSRLSQIVDTSFLAPSKSAVVVQNDNENHDDNKFSQITLKQSSEERNTKRIIINSNNSDSDSDLDSTSPERRD